MAKMAKFEFEVVPLDRVPQEDTATFDCREQKPVVLIVDDERIIADTLAMILGKSGYGVMTAYDGDTAFRLACATPPDLLLTDVAMPGMTGTELAIKVKRAIPSCRVLLFSGHASAVDALAEAHSMGYDFNLLSKPVHPSDLLVRVSECLELSAVGGI
jgi:DNA-binding NtrC family response regulator